MRCKSCTGKDFPCSECEAKFAPSCIANGDGIEMSPRPKIGDRFTIEIEERESWWREKLRDWGIVRKLRKRKHGVFSITQECESSDMTYSSIDWSPK